MGIVRREVEATGVLLDVRHELDGAPAVAVRIGGRDRPHLRQRTSDQPARVRREHKHVVRPEVGQLLDAAEDRIRELERRLHAFVDENARPQLERAVVREAQRRLDAEPASDVVQRNTTSSSETSASNASGVIVVEAERGTPIAGRDDVVGHAARRELPCDRCSPSTITCPVTVLDRCRMPPVVPSTTTRIASLVPVMSPSSERPRHGPSVACSPS